MPHSIISHTPQRFLPVCLPACRPADAWCGVLTGYLQDFYQYGGISTYACSAWRTWTWAAEMSMRNWEAGRSQARDEKQWRQPANWIMVSENNLRVGCNIQNALPLPPWCKVIMLRLSLICWRKSNLQKQEKGNSLLPQFIYKLIYFPQSLRFCSATGCRWQQIPQKGYRIGDICWLRHFGK